MFLPKMKILVILAFSLAILACSDFRYRSDNGIFSARTMDFPYPQFTQLSAIPIGSYYSPDDSNLDWKVSQKYVSFSIYGMNHTADGLNSCGLSCAVLTLVESEYQDKSGNYLGITDLCDYILGQFCDVYNAKNDILGINIYQNSLYGKQVRLHISIHDRYGQSMVLEFIKQHQIWHDNKIGILTNDPTYDFHIKNIELYSYINNISPDKNITINDYTYNPSNLGYAMSNFGISSDDGPISRFARLSQYLRFIPSNNSAILGFHLLEKVSVVPWFSILEIESKLYYGLTIFRVVRDHTRGLIYFVTYNDLVIKYIDLEYVQEGSMLLENLHPVNYLNITGLVTQLQ